MPHYELDTRNLLCPMPVIKTQNLSSKLVHGDTLTIKATDPGTLQDLPCWCRLNGHKLIECNTLGREIHITLEMVKE